MGTRNDRDRPQATFMNRDGGNRRSIRAGAVGAIIKLPRNGKQAIVIATDALILAASVSIAYYLRLGFWLSPNDRQFGAMLAALVFGLPIFWRAGLYRPVFRHLGTAAFKAIVTAVTLYALLFATVFTFYGVAGVPRTVGLIQPLLVLLATLGTRMLATNSLMIGSSDLIGSKRVLVYGAGAAGRQLASAISASREMQIVGFVDDDPRLRSRLVSGLRVHGFDELTEVIEKHNVSDVLLALPSASRRRRNEIISQIRGLGIGVRTLPGLIDLAHGRVSTSDLQPLELEDLLGRDPIPPDHELLASKIVAKTVLVTGAGGSIGSELCRSILCSRPTVLLLVDLSEFSLYMIHQELSDWQVREADTTTQIIPLLGSVCDGPWIARVMQTWCPQTVYHAAAYKHVPLVEHNPAVGVANNVLGTRATAQAAIENGVADFVLISTDKAVRPTNVMGTSKRLAELTLQALDGEQRVTRFSMVRFGNVLGSSGSVVPLFRRQIAAGGPVTVTHPEIERYFMTIPEAAQLVIQAGAMAEGGDVFVLDMGEPVKIVDLARNMIELSGFRVRDAERRSGTIEIAMTGLRPGEKLYEELLIGNSPVRTSHPRIIRASEPSVAWSILKPALEGLDIATRANDVDAIFVSLRALVPDFKPQSGVVDWHVLAGTREPAERHAQTMPQGS